MQNILRSYKSYHSFVSHLFLLHILKHIRTIDTITQVINHFADNFLLSIQPILAFQKSI